MGRGQATMNTYTLLLDDGRASELPGLRLEAENDVEVLDLAQDLLGGWPTVRHIVIMRRSTQVAIVSRPD